MKLTLSVLACCALPLLAQAGEPAPAIPIDRVLQIAKDSLAQRHAEVYIQSISLQKPTMFSGNREWFVQWSRPIQGSKPGVKEIGLSVKPDGKIVHVIQ